MPTEPSAITHGIVARVREVSHTYKTATPLDAVSVDIAEGEMIGLVGPDGVGKSTLLSLIAGARKLQKGQLQVLGGEMSNSAHRRSISPRIAYMPQGLGKNLYEPLSIRENLDFFGKLFGLPSAERAARIDQLTSATGLKPYLTRPAGKLSGGMKQKLGLCCALIHDPDLMILDEPTTGVDPLSRRQLWELIDKIKANRPKMSVLVSTAYMDEAERFDQLIAMNAGRILACDTPAGLKRQTGTDTIEAAFVSLLPRTAVDGHTALTIPPLDTVDMPPAIVAEGLTRRFGDFTAVQNVSFRIGVGEIFGFLGSNGCGKTTTMKMLTGLLPASEGQAFLFGKPVDTTGSDTRRRVGFMTQSFSLYGELTVVQNLRLHGRLFHMAPKKIDARIEELVARFGLVPYRDALASALPLGIRQRLSLAVAVIHEPEMLILDEPTSGVDPVARDDFWKLLVELSRRDRVTIFISTHFMSEAMRCDRISLMHEGRVLVRGTPQDLVESKGAPDLEAAFISYIEDDMSKSTDIPADTPSPLGGDLGGAAHIPPPRPKAASQAINRALAFSTREMLEVVRDPIRMAFAFLGSMFLLLMIAFGISHDVEDVTFAALDFDQSPESRAYLLNFSGSRYFIEKPELQSHAEFEARLTSNDITLALEIPRGFGEDVRSGSRPEVSAWIDGANTQRAGTIEGYVSGGHFEYLDQHLHDSGQDIAELELVTVETRYLYNPSFESIYAVGPSVPAMLLMLFPAILMAVSVVREKEIGTITNFYVTPTSRTEFLVGKQLPYVVIGLINFFAMCLLVIFVLQVPLKGSILALTLGALLYVTAATGFGLLMSTFTRTQVAAVFATAILSLLPTIQFSGMLQPISTLEGGAWLVGNIWPTSYFVHLSVGAFTKGLGPGDVLSDLAFLLIYAPVFTLVSAFLLKKQEL
ncbi:ribosome-associated ATPase/putative transporter RbbA [Roseobacter weihaiensis]|uniref:ribosome-associated ATPase/putative transporter RbbA n=1 Tax=Roseobacter weihaiensis TaxID=2763262 RepID=UPI001D0B2610|nr:ribosome-associated ATPase/putative transporter RbbA [Roseobacter sp. H9]